MTTANQVLKQRELINQLRAKLPGKTDEDLAEIAALAIENYEPPGFAQEPAEVIAARRAARGKS